MRTALRLLLLALGPHPQRELTLMPRLGVTWPRRGMAAGAIIIMLALVVSACSDDSPSTTAPTTTPAPTCPCTETFSSAVAPSGTTSHSFTAGQAGSVAVTLTSSGPPSNVTLGVGVGIPTTSTSGVRVCSLSTALNTAPGTTAQLTVPVDAGGFCIKIFDPGGPPLPGVAFFSLTISRP